MNTAYHEVDSASSSHECQDPPARALPRVNPYTPPVPTIGRLLDLLLSYGPPGTLIETNNRAIAKALGQSLGQIPDLLRRLEADGHITRITHTRGTLIEVRR